MTTSTRPDAPDREADVVELLIGQHMQIRDLFAEVQAASGARRDDAFARLVRLLAVHETAEEMVVHPAARRGIDGGDAIVADRLAEENEAKEQLAHLESLGTEDPEFAAGLERLRDAVLRHAHHEETYEFRYLREYYDADRLHSMAAMVRAAERTAPTHPHPGTESATANIVTGPVVSLFDRVKDAMRSGLSHDDERE
ncbi:hemerythrin domain-containing protein [Saccharothrix australiensis]|uniref:Hemerythrin HHE cation binding domain-containing protein n=1 Tax=Saccharothrix australiensis TaxID=2072 RepID=A0A495W5S9_9PSEU|nr:hemerythrin domain-containing protein [Saccharothrix australiensis]RKT56155.1 hemerythrin HHE cation binding domain-containing protein [Saccharothrix australiensis]